MLLLSIGDTPLEPATIVCRHSANLGDLQRRAAWSLLDTTEECFYPFSNRFYQFLTTPQMHLVNIQCDNAPERALHLTGEEEEDVFGEIVSGELGGDAWWRRG